MANLLFKLGIASVRRAWSVIIAWVVILGIAVGALALTYAPLPNSFDIPGTASGKVIDELGKKLPKYAGASGLVVFSNKDGAALTDTQRNEIAALVPEAKKLPDIADVIDPFNAQATLSAQTQQIADGKNQLNQGQEQLDQQRTQLEAGQQQLSAGQSQLDAAQEQLTAGRQQAQAAGMPTTQLDEQQAALDAQKQELQRQKEAADAGQQKLESAQKEIDAQRSKLENGEHLAEYAKAIRMVSEDGSTALMNLSFDVPRLELQEASKTAVIDYFTAHPVAGVETSFSTDIAQGVPKIFGVGEAVGLAVAAVVLLVMLGSVLAAVFPLVTAIVGVGVGVSASLSFAGLVDMSSVTPVLGVMLGLAVGIDYSLFIINRHRKQLLEGMPVDTSIGLANGTAGNAVVFAGATVVVALLALNITGVPFLGVMGSVGAACVAVSVLLAVTMIPALLGLSGERLLSKRARAVRARAVSAPTEAAEPAHAPTAPVRAMPTWRAALTAVASIAALLVLALPMLDMRVGLPDGGSEPEGSYANVAFHTVNDKFGEGENGPLLVTADLPAGLDDDGVLAAQATVAKTLFAQKNVVAVAPVDVSEDHRLTAFQIIPKHGPNSISTDTLVRDLRELPPVDGNIKLGVAGQAAINIDISTNLVNVLPLYLAVVIGLSLLIMIMVFRSILVPLIATGGFVLSLFATYGALVAVFQWGWLSQVFGIHETGPLLSFLPVILIGVLFGLAMDYQLFLATGMREAWAHGAPARVAVMKGVHAGRAVVIAAGLIMVSVFGGFVFSESMMIRSIGFGLAFGVLADAFIVRLLLMPALMHLLGGSAWWLPKWLDRLIPNVDVEGASLERREHHRAEAAAQSEK